jgi:hypothetical protein
MDEVIAMIDDTDEDEYQVEEWRLIEQLQALQRFHSP